MLALIVVFPHGAPTLSEVKSMVAHVRQSFVKLKASLGGNEPGIVTVCRSVGSGFTPKGKAARFYSYFMDAIESEYGNALVRTRSDASSDSDAYASINAYKSTFKSGRTRQRQKELRA